MPVRGQEIARKKKEKEKGGGEDLLGEGRPGWWANAGQGGHGTGGRSGYRAEKGMGTARGGVGVLGVVAIILGKARWYHGERVLVG